VKKSSAGIPGAWDRRNSAQLGPSRRGARLIPALLRICQTVDGATRDAEPRELAMDPPVSPRLVLPGQPQHHCPHPAMRCRAPGAAPARQPRPPAADDIAVPAQDRAGSDDQPHRRQALRRHRPRKQRQPRPVRPRQPPMSARPLALGDRELMAQHKNLGVLLPPLPPRQAQQRPGTGDNQEDQLHAHKPKIIPRPGRRGTEQPAARGQRSIQPGDAGFRHPQSSARASRSRRDRHAPPWPRWLASRSDNPGSAAHWSA